MNFASAAVEVISIGRRGSLHFVVRPTNIEKFIAM